MPRFSTFGSRQKKPFYTELCVYQNEASAEEDNAMSASLTIDEESMENSKLPEVVCSRICRLYNAEGQMKQGCTSFFSLKRFGIGEDP